MNAVIDELLTPKQRAFCDEYMVDRNATAAALRAGYAKSIALNGYLMTIPKIKMHLQERTAEAAKKAQVTQEMVIAELCKIAFGNMRNYFLPDGGLKPAHELSEDEAAALWSMSIADAGSGAVPVGDNTNRVQDDNARKVQVTTTKIRMYNKLSALDKIAKMLNFYNAEPGAPEKEYVYLSEEQLRADDAYGDEAESPEAKARAQEPDVPLAPDGDILCDQAGNLKYRLDMRKSLKRNLSLIQEHEQRLGRPIKKVWMEADKLKREFRASDLAIDLQVGVSSRGRGLFGDTGADLCEKFEVLRELMQKNGEIPTFTQVLGQERESRGKNQESRLLR
jgi:phage terminase small subunit